VCLEKGRDPVVQRERERERGREKEELRGQSAARRRGKDARKLHSIHSIHSTRLSSNSKATPYEALLPTDKGAAGLGALP